MQKKVAPYKRTTSRRWTLDGMLYPTRESLIRHLKLGHGFSGIDDLSYEELLSLHDDDHNKGIKSLYFRLDHRCE